MVLGCRLIAPDPDKKKGRFSLGKWSIPITLIGFSWAIFAIFAFVLPTSWPVTGTLLKRKAWFSAMYTE
jgi:hypothetical protein